MTKVISVEKMSKKAQKEYYSKQRKSWGMSPITRCPERPNVYNRAKEKHALRAAY